MCHILYQIFISVFAGIILPIQYMRQVHRLSIILDYKLETQIYMYVQYIALLLTTVKRR